MNPELLVVYPPHSIKSSQRLLLAPLLFALMLAYFGVRLFQSLFGRLSRIGTRLAPVGSVPVARYNSSIYNPGNLRLSDLPRGNCWRQMVSAVPEASTILDVGCSTGHLGKLLLESKPCQVDGVEIDREAAAEAARTYRRVHVGNLSDSGFLHGIPDKSYDVLLFMDVLEHLAEPNQLLAHSKSKLNDRGRVVASIPNVAYWQVRFEVLRGRFNYTDLRKENSGILDVTHLRFFTLSTMQHLFREAGYSIQWVAATMPGWHPLYAPLARIPWGDNLRLSLIQAFPQLLSRQFLIQAILDNGIS